MDTMKYKSNAGTRALFKIIIDMVLGPKISQLGILTKDSTSKADFKAKAYTYGLQEQYTKEVSSKAANTAKENGNPNKGRYL